MLNQVILVGTVSEIFSDDGSLFKIKTASLNITQTVEVPIRNNPDIDESLLVDNLAIGTMIGIKGRLNYTDEDGLSVISEKVTFVGK